MADIRLVTTDLDGTLLGTTRKYFEYTAFRRKIGEFCAARGARWIVCTGRSKRGFLAMFAPALKLGIRPDFVIARDAYVYTFSRRGRFVPDVAWNVRTRRAVDQHREAVRAAYTEWRDLLTSWDFGVIRSSMGRRRLLFRFQSEEAAEKAFELLRARAAPYSHLKLGRFSNVVHIEAMVFTKGLAVRRVTQSLGLGPEHVLAIGDGHNDISMMASDVAKYTGCPRNACSDVMSTVHDRGGHVARNDHLAGVMEILDAYTDGKIVSDLPPEWRPPGPPDDVDFRRLPESRQKRLMLAGVCLLTALAVLVLLVLGWMRLLPFPHLR